MAMDVLLDEKNEGEASVGMKGGGYEAPMMKNELVSGEELLYELGDDVDASDDAENGEMGLVVEDEALESGVEELELGEEVS